MSSSIGGIGGGSATMIQGIRRPDPGKMAEKLFSKLDSSGRGYIGKADLQAAFDGISSSASSSGVDELFSKLDTDSDGKVTQQEFSETLKQLAVQLDSQFMDARMNGMPPPPPPGGDAGGLAGSPAVAGEIGASNSSLVNNFDSADTDGDGKVSFVEAMAARQKTSASDSASSSEASYGFEPKLMMQIMKLMQAYGHDQTGGALSSTLSVSV